ncbi:MAG: proteasome accessory factor PafA2 family protein [Armatimonadetes bacterium]|nr:proteasome accessory factor PafA2 family protein [Armatimonadota bacterium]
MNSILAGIETEYGLMVSGHEAPHQIDDAVAFLKACPLPAFAGWNYRYESPRADLRGFTVQHLAVDPEDLKFEKPTARERTDAETRSDRVLENGARFYNDHGHPEFSTPESWSLDELANFDHAGELCLLRTLGAFQRATGLAAKVYKNNTDFHGASYGTHESYLTPRAIGFDRLRDACVPMLVARTILCGAGKVGAEAGDSATYQLSQRADFFSEIASVDTLYRRPLFNTRDEAHADSREWIRLHVIAGDANMSTTATKLKVGLIKLSLALEAAQKTPQWSLADPVTALKRISRDESLEFAMELEGGAKTSAYQVIESYLAAAESVLGDDSDLQWTIRTARSLMDSLRSDQAEAARHIDWLAKRRMLEQFMDHADLSWRSPELQAYDLEYHNIDPVDGLSFALAEMGVLERPAELQTFERFLQRGGAGARSFARGLAVSKFAAELKGVCWRTLTFEVDGELKEVELLPDQCYEEQLEASSNVEAFINAIGGE